MITITNTQKHAWDRWDSLSRAVLGLASMAKAVFDDAEGAALPAAAAYFWWTNAHEPHDIKDIDEELESMETLPDFTVDYNAMWESMETKLREEVTKDPNTMISPLQIMAWMEEIQGTHIRGANEDIVKALADLARRGKTGDLE